MKAMILAAGKGTRVRPITHAIPKPMIPIMRKPVMESIIELLSQHGVDDVVVNTSHLAPVIENYFRDGHHLGVQLAYSYEGIRTEQGFEDRVMGSAGGMKKVQSFSGFFDETFIVLCGDAGLIWIFRRHWPFIVRKVVWLVSCCKKCHKMKFINTVW